uniref:Cadherin domain-containing protein n=1 Tax=Plectus sambesii TaxID=2011161 RepID=A0A914UXS3_9BILA
METHWMAAWAKYALMGGEGRSPRLSSTGRVIITVLDSNDNTPVFDQPYYTAQIAENATVGTKILQVTATDTDKDANGAIHYSLRKSNDALPFAIDSETGVISTKKLLDRETFSSWTMAVIAEDSGEIFRQSSSINVTVTILDVNDNAPIIRNGRLDAYIKNSLTTGDFVYAVDAFDPDEGINGRLKFELSGKDAAKFSIDQNGVIVSTVAVKALDTFSLMATVYDGMGLN